jgi:hypothetical protein
MTPQPSPDAQKLLEAFPFRYVGGGYYRNCEIPIGEPAETLHGDELLRRFADHANAYFSKPTEGILELLKNLNPKETSPTHLDCIAREHCQSHPETKS